MLTGYFLSRFY